MEIKKGSVVVFVDGSFPKIARFIVIDVSDGLLLLECVEINYRIGGVSPSQVKVVE